ncbi:MAG: hypothetical protein M1828_003633 [Chrysothrix sp. TS-e1954]|nr:MAG: hypothetical protein M1828_003633 [Chrysothrix sp. TS-e1954]
MDIRIEDYLNDKLQTFADFEALDSLIANVQSQQDLLRKQLHDAEDELTAAEDAVDTHTTSTNQRNVEHQAAKAELDRRLVAFTQADTPHDAQAAFLEGLEKLKELESANGYMQIWEEVSSLSKTIKSQLETTPETSLKTYGQLSGLSNSLEYLENSDELAQSVAAHVKDTAKQLKQAIQAHFSSKLEDVLSKILWPKTDAALPDALRPDFNAAVNNLLTLQRPELEARELASPESRVHNQPAVLLPLEIMVKPLATRFRYHFSGDRPTNRLDKPEYFFAHVLEILSTYIDFVSDNVQPVLFSHFKASKFPDAAYLDATSAFITSLLPMLRSKISSILPQVSNQPQLLAHLVHELTNFDTILRDEWRYDGGTNSTSDWNGLTGEVLTQQNWFDSWLRVEKDFALARYHSIIDDKATAVLDYDGVALSATKPTKAAVRVHDLLATVTSLYRSLSSFEQKLRFLLDIQLSIFDQFHTRLRSGLESVLQLSTSLGRTLPNVTAEDIQEVQGVKGLDRLCRIYGSAHYLEAAMRDWSDDVLFLELWVELQDRAKSQDRESSIAGPLSIAQVAQATSSSLTTSDDDDDLETNNAGTTGALFDETATIYSQLRSRSERVLIETLTRTTRDSLRPYTNAPTSSSAEPDGPSPSLAGAMSILAESCSFLSRAIGATPLRRMLKQVVTSMETYIFDRVILNHIFTLAGAQQLAIDISALEASIQNNTSRRSSGEPLFLRLAEAARLLCLEVAQEEEEGGEGDAWGAVDDDQNDTLGLWHVERRLFYDNESARGVLADLGIETLSESEARNVIRRRAELQ